MEIGSVFRQRRDIGHTGIQVTGTDSMPHNLLLLQNRHMILAVGIQAMPIRTPPGFFNEIFCHIQIFPVSGHFIQFGKSHFDNRMAGGYMFLHFVRTEILTDQICIFDGDIKQATFACRLIMGHGSLIKMPAVIELMAVQFFPTACPPPAIQPFAFIRHTGSQVAVRFLCSSDQRNDTVQVSIQIRIIFNGK